MSRGGPHRLRYDRHGPAHPDRDQRRRALCRGRSRARPRVPRGGVGEGWCGGGGEGRGGVPAPLATNQAEVDRVTGAMLCDLLVGCDDFGERITPSTPLLTDAERSHMRDVARLVRVLWLVLVVAVGLLVAGAVALRRE